MTQIELFLSGCGEARDLQAFFGGKLKVDRTMRSLLEVGGDWQISGVGIRFDQCWSRISDEEIIDGFPVDIDLTRQKVFGVLAYLDTEDGKKVLVIPAGSEETDVVLGYLGDCVAYIEHTHTREGEEFRLRLSHKKDEWRLAPKVLVSSHQETYLK